MLPGGGVREGGVPQWFWFLASCVISLCYTALNWQRKFWKVLHSLSSQICGTTIGHWDEPWRPVSHLVKCPKARHQALANFQKGIPIP